MYPGLEVVPVVVPHGLVDPLRPYSLPGGTGVPEEDKGTSSVHPELILVLFLLFHRSRGLKTEGGFRRG